MKMFSMLTLGCCLVLSSLSAAPTPENRCACSRCGCTKGKHCGCLDDKECTCGGDSECSGEGDTANS